MSDKSAEQIVRDAYTHVEAIWTSRGWRIIADIPGVGGEVIGRTDSAHAPEAEAWADAARRLDTE